MDHPQRQTLDLVCFDNTIKEINIQFSILLSGINGTAIMAVVHFIPLFGIFNGAHRVTVGLKIVYWKKGFADCFN